MSQYQPSNHSTCSFCHQPRREGVQLIGANDVSICSTCVNLCMEIIHDKPGHQPVVWGDRSTPVPAEIKEFLDQYVVGQDLAKRKIAVAVYNHYKRLEANNRAKEGDVEIRKSNVLLIGSTGTGKTLIASTLARKLGVPFTIADATTLTQAGYVGEDVENIIVNLYNAADKSVERTQRGIVYLDEIDKLARKGAASSVSRDVSGEGVQQALLKILEGTVANVQIRGQKGQSNKDTVQIDTRDILFIVGGSFEGLDRLIEQRIGRRSVGYGRDDPMNRTVQERRRILQKTTSEDLEQFGLIPEFMGRLPVIAVMDPLETEDLVHILTEPKNALVRQYEKLLRFEKVKLTLTDDAVREIATLASSRGTGARGLRAIMESVMLDLMYDVPSIEDISEVIVTGEVVKGEAAAEYVTASRIGVPN
ncbi:MAG: ATP-dependent Clp protease ATP-binding subunit ClpX [Deltaproteobacteria bacterium]|nr:ATP-dependent Clp protease ATP-binding subunit ClpX [Deltaproteobacteria bacterium]